MPEVSSPDTNPAHGTLAENRAQILPNLDNHHGAMFINDLFDTGGPAVGDRSLWKETKIGNHVSIGTNATILPVTICDGAVIGAGAVVTKDFDEPGIYVGNPARLLRRL